MTCLDEIQMLPEFFSVLRSEIDKDRRPGRFLILGSVSRDLIRQSTESLAILEQTYMLRLRQPAELNLKKRLIKSRKIYLRDSGILQALLDIETYDNLLANPLPVGPGRDLWWKISLPVTPGGTLFSYGSPTGLKWI